MKILIIDDSEQFLELAAHTCAELGHEQIKAVNGYEGLALIKKHKPDLVITDIDMPELDGINVSEIASARGYTVYIMTGNDTPYDKALASMSGADGYLVKDANLAANLKAALEVLA